MKPQTVKAIDEVLLRSNLFSAYHKISNEVLDERLRQNRKFTSTELGRQRHNIITWSAILSEEAGEVSKDALQTIFGGSTMAKVREEAIQTAAVAFAIIERIDDADIALFASEGTFKND